jgi:hypothetical protein
MNWEDYMLLPAKKFERADAPKSFFFFLIIIGKS